MGIQSGSALDYAYKLIETCEMNQAQFYLKEALVSDLDDKTLVFAIQCCKFWIEPLAESKNSSFFEQGENLLNQWKNFLIIVKDNDKTEDDRVVYSFKKGIFTLALEFYKKSNDEKDPNFKSEILRKTGLCYKKLGSYEVALEFLAQANGIFAGQPSVLAEMADCYALCGETKNAKMLFREAFFIDAQKIELEFLDSPLIKVLTQEVERRGYEKLELKEWIPVYGVIFGVFNVKRSLRTQEFLRLKQEIYAKENELKDPANNKKILLPRLLNLYFWQIDSCILSKESVSIINEIMLKIKILDLDIYKMYTE